MVKDIKRKTNPRYKLKWGLTYSHFLKDGNNHFIFFGLILVIYLVVRKNFILLYYLFLLSSDPEFS